MGTSVDAKTDAVRRLEEAGMIAVQRPKGGYLKVRMTWKEVKIKVEHPEKEVQ
jgi:hypothetical protein